MSRKNSLDQTDSFIFHTSKNSMNRSSIAASLESLYENFNVHIHTLKWSGLVILLSMMLATLVVTTNIYSSVNLPSHNCSDCIQIKTCGPNICKFVKQINLPHNYILSICEQFDEVDIREFFRGKPTNNAVQLNIDQLRYIKRILPTILKNAKRRN
ncbi:unnamed protein product [Mytilus coruscus]|uniref:Uncharacterized protein n=1 Tax=Mytilus coruscus TaxID=42192 RepID=A0A6J8ALN3_MYTCO|nr:unnamed protein product [Mytilus coruscus]